jgi:hypothetical protein
MLLVNMITKSRAVFFATATLLFSQFVFADDVHFPSDD